MDGSIIFDSNVKKSFIIYNTMDKFLYANWILQKLGKDAKGKRVEVHHSSDNAYTHDSNEKRAISRASELHWDTRI
ncbi:hypothetical protein MTR67_004196 [Solanum verrucosum]|uniref:Uncharacterized protein n=1 Tax=Solanum verrucosum TaxID=315347 RepID=A0AAF0PYF4_SOLVR|nr:hypothetical protein MTR67_004196 [Solanum verrucosum]